MTVGRFAVGARFEARLNIDAALVDRFTDLSGDHNPIHETAEAAREFGHPGRVAHGVLTLALLSRLIGMEIPGPGALWLRQESEWSAPVYVGDEVVLTVTVSQYSPSTAILTLVIDARDQRGRAVMRGTAQVKAPTKLTESRTASVTTSGSVALIAGGSGGIGSAVARKLASSGHRVALSYHSSGSRATNLVKELAKGGASAQAFQADLEDPAAAAQLVGEILAAFGRIDAVVHCATPPLPKAPVAQLSRADLDTYWATYVGAAIDLVRLATPGMIERRFGRLVFLGTAAMSGAPPQGWAPYLIAKHALYGLVRSLATELGPQGITANMISPGIIVTPLTADIPTRAKEVEAHRSPARRLAEPDDVAAIIDFLLRTEAGYINGQNLPLTGGPA